jgi:hypothetical protein
LAKKVSHIGIDINPNSDDTDLCAWTSAHLISQKWLFGGLKIDATSQEIN